VDFMNDEQIGARRAAAGPAERASDLGTHAQPGQERAADGRALDVAGWVSETRLVSASWSSASWASAWSTGALGPADASLDTARDC
jgi:hypothetical protein